ncbi:MAG: ThiF protein, partial [Candidatus Magasanikbacteria bacterium]|nr:ThiF protein [Candidatus Magasanikbacteria bacterium]
EIGRTLVSWPQLGGAALLNGSAVAYCVRKIVTGQKLMDDRALVSLDALLVPNFNTPEEIQKRHNDAETFRKMFGLN